MPQRVVRPTGLGGASVGEMACPSLVLLTDTSGSFLACFMMYQGASRTARRAASRAPVRLPLSPARRSPSPSKSHLSRPCSTPPYPRHACPAHSHLFRHYHQRLPHIHSQHLQVGTQALRAQTPSAPKAGSRDTAELQAAVLDHSHCHICVSSSFALDALPIVPAHPIK